MGAHSEDGVVTQATLVMVYNADGGVFAALTDAVHKLVSPATYPCSLCAVSYGAVTMRHEWRDYLASLPIPRRFHHRDDFARAWPGLQIDLPAILLDRGGEGPDILIGAAELDRLESASALIAAVDGALMEHLSFRRPNITA